MNRKLHNSLTAAMACSVLLTAVLLTSVPVEPVSAAVPAIAAGQADTTGGITATLGDRPVSRRSQQSVRMPFFSFFLPQG